MERNGYCVAYNSTKQLLYKITVDGAISVFFDDIRFKALAGRQFRCTTSQQLLIIQTGANELVLLNGLEKGKPQIANEIKPIPGGEIIDFQVLDENYLLTLSCTGVLNCFDIGGERPEFINSDSIYLESNQRARSLSLNKEHQLAVVTLSRSKSDYALEKGSEIMKMVQHTSIETLIYDLILDQGRLIRRYSKKFKIVSGVEEGDFQIETNCSLFSSGEVYLILMMRKSKSEVHCFEIGEDSLSLISNFKMRNSAAAMGVFGHNLWIVDEPGALKLYG